tara:strand:+ start:1010 stop:1291 length:282 start_codon:yes stop_codon:yes gene_type:complete
MLTKEQAETLVNLPPQAYGQMRNMLITGEAPEGERGHWYSPDAVREMLAPTHAKILADTIARYLRKLGPHQRTREGAVLLFWAERALRAGDNP